MIGRLKGVVDGFGPDWALIDVRGVGYVVTCSSRTLQALPPVGEAATLSIETYVREQEIRLFGFPGDTERDWFRLLQTVQGVGAKVALAVLGILPPRELATAIALGDAAAVARAPGVGPKVAARICAELKDKAPALASPDGSGVAMADAAAANLPGAAADALSALVNLGYARLQAAQAIASALREAGEGADAQRLIRGGLKALAA